MFAKIKERIIKGRSNGKVSFIECKKEEICQVGEKKCVLHLTPDTILEIIGHGSFREKKYLLVRRD